MSQPGPWPGLVKGGAQLVVFACAAGWLASAGLPSSPPGLASPRHVPGRARRSGGPRSAWSSRPAPPVSRLRGRPPPRRSPPAAARSRPCRRWPPLELDPELARVGRLGADHVADGGPVRRRPRALAQLGRGGGGDLVEGPPGRGDQAGQPPGRGRGYRRPLGPGGYPRNGRRHSGAANAVAGPPGTRSTTSKTTVAPKLTRPARPPARTARRSWPAPPARHPRPGRPGTSRASPAPRRQPALGLTSRQTAMRRDGITVASSPSSFCSIFAATECAGGGAGSGSYASRTGS